MPADLDPKHVDSWDSRLGNTVDARLKSWDTHLEKNRPDCRVSFENRERSRVQIGRMMWDKVYCAQCHKVQGAVLPSVAHVFFVCDVCFAKTGQPPGCVQVSL